MSELDPREQLSAYLDGALAAAERERVDEALAVDPALRTELEELRELIDDVHSLSAEQAPAGFAASVMAEVKVYPIPGGEGLDQGVMASGDDRIVVSWWVKGPVVSLLAASLVMAVVIYNAERSVPVPSSLRPAVDLLQGSSAARLESSDRLQAPLPTGGDGFEDDGVVDAPADSGDAAPGGDVDRVKARARKPSSGSSPLLALDSSSDSEELAADPQAGSVGDGDALADGGPAPPKQAAPARKRQSGLKELRGSQAEAEQIYEADHEVWAREVVATEDGLTAGVNEQAPTAEPATSGAEPAVVDEAGAQVAEEETDGVVAGGPPKKSVEGSGDRLVLRAEKHSSSMIEFDEKSIQTGALRRGGGGPSRRSATAAVPETVAEPEAPAEVEAEADDERSIAVGVVIGSLRIEQAFGLSLLRTEIRRRGWSMQDLTPIDLEEEGKAVKSYIIQLMVPEGDEEQLVELLRRHGVLSTDGVLRAGRDGMARLRVTVKEWFGGGSDIQTGAARRGD